MTHQRELIGTSETFKLLWGNLENIRIQKKVLRLTYSAFKNVEQMTKSWS